MIYLSSYEWLRPFWKFLWGALILCVQGFSFGVFIKLILIFLKFLKEDDGIWIIW